MRTDELQNRKPEGTTQAQVLGTSPQRQCWNRMGATREAGMEEKEEERIPGHGTRKQVLVAPWNIQVRYLQASRLDLRPE